MWIVCKYANKDTMFINYIVWYAFYKLWGNVLYDSYLSKKVQLHIIQNSLMRMVVWIWNKLIKWWQSVVLLKFEPNLTLH